MDNIILPHALPVALHGRDGIRLLSLDCFDTLLWRDCHAPRDVFGTLHGMTVPQRQWAESRARTAAALRDNRNEVSIDEIYRELLPNGAAEDRTNAAHRELLAEAAHCFAFVPTVELMRDAKRRGLPVIIVSDTYLDEVQLRSLIAEAAGDDVLALIDRVFCSSVYGKSKAEGLYGEVLKTLDVAPHEILHIGDNLKSDVKGVAPFGVTTLHLKQFSDTDDQRLRLEAAMGAMLHPGPAAGAPQPHRAAIAATEGEILDAGEAFGFSVIGPVMHGFDQWLRSEAAALQARHGGQVHWLFLMRDGHLPHLMHAAAGSSASAHAVEISRFTAQAAALTNKDAVLRYVQYEAESDLDAVGRQLMLAPGEIALLKKQLPKGDKAPAALVAAVQQPDRMRRIVKNGSAFADRLVEHIRALAAPAPGDTLMLVDLGYNGTVQNEVEPLLRDRLGVHVAGRYLLLREQFQTGFDKQGFIDERHYRAVALEALCGNVAVLEQLSTAAQGSVIDYKADGTPIRRESSIKGRQSEMRDRIQAGAARFAQAQGKSILRRVEPDAAKLWRPAAASALARLMFLPLPQELAVIAQFEHDVNLGVDHTVPLFAPQSAQRGLRQRGLFYMKGSERMYLPAELQGEGLAVKLSLIANKLFGLSLTFNDFVDHAIDLPILIADGRQVFTDTVAAMPTHDGYYVAAIPIGDCRYSVGLQFGKLYDWLQIDSAVFLPVKHFLSEKHAVGVGEIDAMPTLEGMAQAAPHLFQCGDESAFMMVPPPPRRGDTPMMLAVTFRPIAARQAAVAPAQAGTALPAAAAA